MPKPSLADQIRAAIKAQGITAYRVAQVTGMHESAVGRFLNNKTADLRLKNASAIMALLGFEIIPPKKGK